VSAFGPGFGALVGTDRTAMLGPEFPETTWRYEVDVKKSVARTTSGDGKLAWEVPLAPFLGCLGVAPAGGEVRTTIVPGNFGGNMDCPEVRAGNTVFLGVNTPGALVSFGDGHFAMGDGEKLVPEIGEILRLETTRAGRLEGFAARQPDLLDPQINRHPREPRDLLVRQNLSARQPRCACDSGSPFLQRSGAWPDHCSRPITAQGLCHVS